MNQDNKSKIINDLLKRISNLEFEVEDLERRKDKALEYINNCIGMECKAELRGILQGRDKK